MARANRKETDRNREKKPGEALKVMEKKEKLIKSDGTGTEDGAKTYAHRGFDFENRCWDQVRTSNESHRQINIRREE
jgi:hypothetical protein